MSYSEVDFLNSGNSFFFFPIFTCNVVVLKVNPEKQFASLLLIVSGKFLGILRIGVHNFRVVILYMNSYL